MQNNFKKIMTAIGQDSKEAHALGLPVPDIHEAIRELTTSKTVLTVPADGVPDHPVYIVEEPLDHQSTAVQLLALQLRALERVVQAQQIMINNLSKKTN